jgi:hypothetical protein
MEKVHLKETRKIVGELEPILINKEGIIIDGRHRKKEYPKWRTAVLDVRGEQVYATRLVKNTQRRTVSKEDYNEYAAFLRANFPAKDPKDTYHVDSGETLAERISKSTGIPLRTIQEKLDSKFKGPQQKDADTASLGEGEQVRVPSMIADDVAEYAEEIRATAKKHPKIASAMIRHVRTDLKKRRETLHEAGKMPPFLHDLVASGKLTIEIAGLIKSKVPQKFRETAADAIAQKRMTFNDAQSYIATQKVVYIAHKAGGKSATKQQEEQEFLPAPVSVKKLEVNGTVTSVEESIVKVKLDDGSSVNFSDLISEVNEALGAIQKKAEIGDTLEITVDLLTRVKRKTIQVAAK